MTVQSIKVKVQRRPSVKLKVLPRFPVDVLGSSPILIDRAGGAYQFSLDIDALSVSVLSAKPITGTSNEISVAHGDGLGGNPTISLPNALTLTGKTVTGGTYSGIASLAIAATTASTSTTTGALTVAGGVGVVGDINAGGYIAALGEIATAATTASTSSITGALRSAGGLGVAGAGNFGGYVMATGGVRPASDGGADIGTSSLRFGTAYLNAITASGQAARTWAMARNVTAATAGQSLTIQAGGAVSGGADLAGGDLVLAAGVATGNAGSVVRIGAATPGASGTADRAVENALSVYRASGGYSFLSLGAVTDWWVAAADGTGDVYYNVPTARAHIFRIASSDKFTFSASSLAVAATTASTSTTTGALTVAGGVGIAGNVSIGGWCATNGEFATLSTSASTSAATGALRSGGGLGVAGAGNFGSYVNVPPTSGYKLGGVTVLDVGSVNFTRVLDPSGAQAFSVGNSAGGFPYLFFDRDETWFRSASLSLYAKMQANGLNVLTTTASTTTTSGSGTFAGGIGVAGDVNVAGYVATGGNVSANGQVTSLTGTGYRAGAGGTVTQSTSKATAVTLNKATGEITTPNDSLAANTTTSFTFTNSMIAATDLLDLAHVSGGTIGGYDLFAVCGSGSATVYIRNRTGGGLSEAIVIRFAVIKAATT